MLLKRNFTEFSKVILAEIKRDNSGKCMIFFFCLFLDLQEELKEQHLRFDGRRR